MEWVTLIVTLKILQEKSVFEIVNVSKDCTDDKLHKTYHELVTKYCLQLSQEVYVIKTTYSKLFQSTWGKGFKMCCYHNSQWLHKNCRKKLILNNWNPIKRLKQGCMMNCLKKHILEYLQRIIYNGEKKCFITIIFLSEYRALNIIYHFEKNHT